MRWHMKINDQVSWRRGDLPIGRGKIVAIKVVNGKKLHMVRDKNNTLYGFREDQLEVAS